MSQGRRKYQSPGWQRRRVIGSSTVMALLLAGCSGPNALRWTPNVARVGPIARRVDTPRTGVVDPRATRVSQSAGDPPRSPEPLPAAIESAADSASTRPDLNDAVPPPDRGRYPIDLTTALRLAEVENPVIAEARVRIVEALAAQQGARALLLPTVRAGGNYHGHAGNLQRSSGRILNLSEQSIYLGGGSQAIAASPARVPAVSIVSPVTEAVFRPLAARQRVASARFAAAATANNVLLEVAELYLDLVAVGAEREWLATTATQAAEVARLTKAYAQVKQGRDADARRATTELRLIEREIRQAEEAVAVTSARLVRRLHLDPAVRLAPVAPSLEPFTLIQPESPVDQLIAVALRQRPEAGVRNAEVHAAEFRQLEEQWRPLLPTLAVGFSGGVFGGGSNLVSPSVGNFRGRTDFDVMLFWTLQNLGAGNASLIRRRRAEVGQAVSERSRLYAEVRSQVAAAVAEAAAARREVDITTTQLRSAESGFQEDLDRIRNVVGRPVEVVNSLNLLNEARIARIRAVNAYNKAQVRLFVALGSPPPLDRPATDPLPPAPIAFPPVGPASVADVAHHGALAH